MVEAKGKHLLIGFSDGVMLHTHLRMTGTWHLYRSGSRWRLPAHLARAVVGVADWEAVCFKAPVVDLYRQPPAHLPQPLDHLGPDLCLEDPPVDEVLARMAARADADSEIAPLLLDQQVAAGIGNVFKSEVLWACRVSPFARVQDLDVETRGRLVDRGRPPAPGQRHLARRAFDPARWRPRRVRALGTAVPRCGTPVQRRLQGEDPRVDLLVPPVPTGVVRVAVIGAGFGGLNAARALKGAESRSPSSTGTTSTPSSRCSTRWPPPA